MRAALTCIFLLAACSAPQRTNMKGWELYCRNIEGATTYTLLPGTNRIKSIEEIEQAPDTAEGLDGACELLATLAPGQTVMISVPRVEGAAERGFFRPWYNHEPGISLKKHAAELDLELTGFITW